MLFSRHPDNPARNRGGLVPPAALRFLWLPLVLAWLAGAQQLPLKRFTVADGLADDGINKIVRDSRGFLWLCTADGLSRFDGYAFVNFGTNQGLPHVEVNTILETRRGEYWVATDGGLARFNPAGKPEAKVTRIEEPGAALAMFSVVPPDSKDRRYANATNVLLEDRDGAIWVGTLDGLYRLTQSRGHFSLNAVNIGLPLEYREQRFISDLVLDEWDSLWIASPSGLYRRWPDGSTAHYTARDGLPGDYLHCLLRDHQGRLWAGSRDVGFFRFAADSTHRPPVASQPYTVRDGMPGWIFELFETSDRRFWAATNLGLLEYFPDDFEHRRNLHVYSTQNGLAFRDVSALGEDLAGNLWLGTLGGAVRFAREGFLTYGEQEGFVSGDAFAEDGSGVCFRGYRNTNTQYLGRFSGDTYEWFLPRALQKHYLGWVSELVTLQGRNGEWWVGTGEGLYRFPPARDLDALKTARPLAVYSTKEGLASAQVFRLFEDLGGHIWVSTISSALNGLARWDPQRGVFEDVMKMPGMPSPKDDLARAFCEDRAGNLWIGFSTGVVRYRHGQFHLYTAKEGLAPGGILQIYLDHAGRLWLASSRSGLIRVGEPNSERPAFVSTTTAQGLSSNRTSVLVEDLNGRLYVGTGRGLDRVDPDTGRVKHFSVGNGLPSAAFRTAFRDSKGTLWFGTAKGLSRFVPLADKSPVPEVVITDLQVPGSPRLISALGERQVALPALRANQNHLQIGFAGLSFESGEAVRYQYKLDGAGNPWSAPTELRTVNYADLSPGSYRFLVRAQSSEGVLSPVPASVTFEILPPFWRRWWFVLLLAMSLVLLGYALHRYRLARLLEIERVRTRIAADLHDDIGSNLTQIAVLSEVAHSRMDPEDPQVKTLLDSIARISRESVASMSDIVWAINPNRDSLLDLVRRMRRFANEALAPRGIQFAVRAPEIEDELKLGAEVRRDVFLIFKEVLNNAVRHADCEKVDIELSVESSRLVLRVSDDGRGFDPEQSGEGQGLASMQRRAASLGGEFRIQSRPGEGTIVSLRVPLRAHRIQAEPARM